MECNLLDSICWITAAKKSHNKFSRNIFIKVKDDLRFCNDTDNLFQELDINHEPNIDSPSHQVPNVLCTKDINIHQYQVATLST